MDPNTQGMISISPELAAGFLALAVALAKIVEFLIRWAVTKIRPTKREFGSSGRPLVVQLDPEVSRLLHDTDENVRDMHMVMGRVDQDGTPMVYSSRSGIEQLREIVVIVKDVSRSQERLAATLDRLDNRLEEHVRDDKVAMGRIKDTLDSIHDAIKD